MAPENFQQLLGIVGVLAGAVRSLGLQRRLRWAMGQGHLDWLGRAYASLDMPALC